MAMSLRPGELVIDHTNHTSDDVMRPRIKGELKRSGLIPRDYSKYPPGYYAGIQAYKSVDMPLIPKSEWSARIKELVATQSQLSDIRLRGNFGQSIPALDQDGYGYCWAHSSTSAVHMLRALANEPYVPMSAFAVAATIKDGRDEGGWGAQSLDFIMQRGVPSQSFWPQKSADLSHGTAECWANAAKHKVTEGWVDLSAAQYDRDLSFDQVATLLLCRIPVVSDFNWWSHSVLAIDLVEVEPGSFGVRILNSWSDSWSDRGMGVLRGSQAIPDGAIAPRQSLPSPI